MFGITRKGMLQQHVVDLQQQRSQHANTLMYEYTYHICVQMYFYTHIHALKHTLMLVNLWGQLFIWHFHNSQQIHARRRLILVAASVWRQPAVHLTNYVDHWGASFQLFYFISVVVAICSIYNKQAGIFSQSAANCGSVGSC